MTSGSTESRRYTLSNWVCEDDVLESLSVLWFDAVTADAARAWFRSSANVTPEGRKRAVKALRMVAHICRSTAFSIELGATSLEEERRLFHAALDAGRRP